MVNHSVGIPRKGRLHTRHMYMYHSEQIFFLQYKFKAISFCGTFIDMVLCI